MWSRSSETSVWSSQHSVRLLRCVWGWSAGSMMRKVSRYGSIVSLSLHTFIYFEMWLPFFDYYYSIYFFLKINVSVLQSIHHKTQSLKSKLMKHELVFFIEIGKWDIPEVVVYSNTSPWQRDHDQKDPQHHWCRKFNQLSSVLLKSYHKINFSSTLSLCHFCLMVKFGWCIFNLMSNFFLRLQHVETPAMTGLSSFYRM